MEEQGSDTFYLTLENKSDKKQWAKYIIQETTTTKRKPQIRLN